MSIERLSPLSGVRTNSDSVAGSRNSSFASSLGEREEPAVQHFNERWSSPAGKWHRRGKRLVLVSAMVSGSLGLLATGQAAAAECSDPDGDGFGWDGSASCDPNEGNVGAVDIDDAAGDASSESGNDADAGAGDQVAAEDTADPSLPTDDIDSDPVDTSPSSVEVDAPASLPVDGVADPVAPAEVVEVSPVAPCVDTAPFNDPWGWNGTESCRLDAAANPLGLCIDSSPVGDGWGWNGYESCRTDQLPAGNQTPTATTDQEQGSEQEVVSTPGEGEVAEPATDVRPKAVVSLGDSFVSGEAGRWIANGPDEDNDRGSAAYVTIRPDGTVDDTANSCRRSDTAEIFTADIAGVEAFNFACTSATTSDIISTSREGEAPQSDQLRDLAATHDVEMVVLSIGGNDVDVAGLAIDCAVKSVSVFGGTCKEDNDQTIVPAIGTTLRADVTDAVRSVKESVEGQDSRIVLQSYVAPYGETNRFDDTISRAVYGCPVNDTDQEWLRNGVINEFDDVYREIATSEGIEFLSLKNAFDGKEICSPGVTSTEGSNSAAELEWINSVSLGPSTLQESLHPNALGQIALGECVSQVYNNPGNDLHVCLNNGNGPNEMTVVHSSLNSAPLA